MQDSKLWNWDEHPMTCTKLEPRPDHHDNFEYWEFQNGPDIALVKVRNLHTAKFHDEIQVTVIEHGYKNYSTPPRNRNRTIQFTTRIIDEFNRIYFKSLEDIFDDLESKVPADVTALPFDYKSPRVAFCKGTTNEEILMWFEHHYRSFTGFCCTDFYDIEQKYKDAEGFLANAIRALYDF